MKRLVAYLAVAAIGICTAPNAAEAQYYYYGSGYYNPAPAPGAPQRASAFRHRLHGYVGGQLTGMVVAKQVTDYAGGNGYLGHGGGGGLFGGIRLSPFVSLELNWLITYHNQTFVYGNNYVSYLDALYMMSFTGDVKIHIPTYGPVEPFFQGGVGFAYLGPTWASGYVVDGGIFSKGPTFDLGGGLDIWLNPWFSLGGRILYRGYFFTEPTYVVRGSSVPTPQSNFVNAVGIDLFATFHF